MLVAYVVLDGFDLGAGIAPPLVARTPDERRLVLPLHRAGLGRQRSLAARRRRHALLRLSRALCLRLQRLLPAADDGAVAAHRSRAGPRAARAPARAARPGDLRRHLHGVEHALAVILGAALGNVVRGVPLDAEGYFFLPLWTRLLALRADPACSIGTPCFAEWSRWSRSPPTVATTSSSVPAVSWPLARTDWRASAPVCCRWPRWRAFSPPWRSAPASWRISKPRRSGWCYPRR